MKARKLFRKRESTTETKGGGFTCARPKPPSREQEFVSQAVSAPFGTNVDEKELRRRYRSLSRESQIQAAAHLNALGNYGSRHHKFGEFGVAVEPEIVSGAPF